jgi:hypothetical protein
MVKPPNGGVGYWAVICKVDGELRADCITCEDMPISTMHMVVVAQLWPELAKKSLSVNLRGVIAEILQNNPYFLEDLAWSLENV